MSEFRDIRFAVADGVATITLHRPEKLNAYTVEMGDEVVAAFARCRADAAVRAVVLTGAGRAFCAGVDLEHLQAHRAAQGAASTSEASAASGSAAAATPPSASEASAASGSAAAATPRQLGEEDFLRKLPLDLVEFPKPVIAAIHGPAIGVGVTMTLPCDVRLAAESARLGLPFAKLGLLPGLGSTHLLPRLVGMAKALELVLTARTIPAAEAAAIGLVNQVVADAELPAAAHAMARAMAEHPPEVLAAAKAALRFGAGATLAEAMRNEQAASAALRETLRGR